MARAALDWTQHELAKASGVSWRTITRFESGESVLPRKVEKLRAAFQGRGVIFIDDGRLVGAVVAASGDGPEERTPRLDN